MAGVLIYGPPKSGKTLLALYCASRAGRPLLLDLDGAPPLLASRVPTLRGDPASLGTIHRALKLAAALGCGAVVVDSLARPLELLGPREVASALRLLRPPPGVELVATSPVYLGSDLRPVKSSIDRSSGELVAAGPGLMLRAPLSRLVQHLWEALYHGAPRRVQAEAEA